MPPNFDMYVRRSTWVHRLDPRVKFFFAADAGLLLFLLPSIWLAAAVVALALVLMWQAQVPRRRVLGTVVTLAPLLVLVFLLTALFTQAGDAAAWLRAGPAALTPGSLLLAVMLTLRLLALALVIFLWLFTTDQAAMVRGFMAMGLPYTWGLTLALALRYVPIFAGLFDQVREAQQARGLDLGQGRFLHRVNLYRPILVSMIIIAVRQSEQLGWALESRGLGASGVPRTTYRRPRMGRVDWILTAILLAVLILATVLRASRVL